MFPNIRLLIGAVFASVVALSCGFGIFAAFRVNHEPLSRLPADTAALQLVTSEAAGPHPAWGAPFGSRFGASETVSEARIGGVTDTPTPAATRGAGTITPEAATDASQERAPPAPKDPPAPIASASEPPEPSAPIADAPAPAAFPAATPTAPAQQTPAAETQSAQPAPDVRQAAPGQTDEPATPPVPAVAAIEPPPHSTPPAAQPAEITGSVPEAAAPETENPRTVIGSSPRPTLRKTVRKPIERRRIVARKRIIRKTRPRAVAQPGYENSDFRNPVFQSAPDAFQRQPATNRRTARKTGSQPANDNAPANSFGLATPE